MKAREIRKDVFFVGAVDWDRRLFDSLISLPDGTSYNSYLVKGKNKTVLIDTVDPSRHDVLFGYLQDLGIENIDYVVFNHAEEDHSGNIIPVLEKFPGAVPVCSPRCQGLLTDRFKVPAEKFKIVEDGETLDLGGRTLQFIHTPWVHWPETMSTYLKEEKILFSCDFFGSHVATSDLFVTDEGHVYQAAKRYFAEIMLPFRTNIQKNLEKLKDIEIEIIAPSHGPLYGRPGLILDAYRHWVFDEPGNIVVIPYVTMHDVTRYMVEYLVGALTERGVTAKQFELSGGDAGNLAMALIDAATIVIGTPTVLAGPHPAAAHAAFLANSLRPPTRFVSIIGSYGWGGKTVELLSAMIPNLKAEILEPVIVKGYPDDEGFWALDNLAETIAAKHREAGLS